MDAEYVLCVAGVVVFFFFNDTATTEIYTLSLTTLFRSRPTIGIPASSSGACRRRRNAPLDRKSTRLNSSHLGISYAVFCLKKKQQRAASRIQNTRRLRSLQRRRRSPRVRR